MTVLLAFSVFLHPFPSVAKKLGGKLEVVSFDDDLEGGLHFCLFFFFWKWAHSGVDIVCVHLTECVHMCSWRKAPSCSNRSLCIRNWSDICGSELESSCIFQQGSHVVLHRKGTCCMDAWIALFFGLKEFDGWVLKQCKLCLCGRAWTQTWSNHRQLPNFSQLLF